MLNINDMLESAGLLRRRLQGTVPSPTCPSDTRC